MSVVALKGVTEGCGRGGGANQALPPTAERVRTTSLRDPFDRETGGAWWNSVPDERSLALAGELNELPELGGGCGCRVGCDGASTSQDARIEPPGPFGADVPVEIDLERDESEDEHAGARMFGFPWCDDTGPAAWPAPASTCDYPQFEYDWTDELLDFTFLHAVGCPQWLAATMSPTYSWYNPACTPCVDANRPLPDMRLATDHNPPYIMEFQPSGTAGSTNCADYAAPGDDESFYNFIMSSWAILRDSLDLVRNVVECMIPGFQNLVAEHAVLYDLILGNPTLQSVTPSTPELYTGRSCLATRGIRIRPQCGPTPDFDWGGLLALGRTAGSITLFLNDSFTDGAWATWDLMRAGGPAPNRSGETCALTWMASLLFHELLHIPNGGYPEGDQGPGANPLFDHYGPCDNIYMAQYVLFYMLTMRYSGALAGSFGNMCWVGEWDTTHPAWNFMYNDRTDPATFMTAYPMAELYRPGRDAIDTLLYPAPFAWPSSRW